MVRREISPQACLAGRPIVQARVAATLARLAAAATWRALVRGERLVSSGKLASLSQCVECVVHKRDRQVRRTENHSRPRRVTHRRCAPGYGFLTQSLENTLALGDARLLDDLVGPEPTLLRCQRAARCTPRPGYQTVLLHRCGIRPG